MLLRLNIKARHDIPEFLNANLLSMHLIAFDVDWSWNIFTQSGAWAVESLLLGLHFFCIFENSWINKATYPAVSQLRRSTIATISVHVPDQQMWASAGPGPSSSSPKTVEDWKSDGRNRIYNSVSARLPLAKFKKEKIIESAAILKKRACQCTYGLIATQNDLGAAERFSTHQESNSCPLTLCDSH